MIVTGSDKRQPVFETSYADEDIILCIGQLRMCYNEKNGYSITTVGTGTVFWVSPTHKAYIITAAHNVRHTVRHCNHCNKYMELSVNNQKIKY